MLRLRAWVFSHVPSSPSTSPIFPLQRLLSTTAGEAAISPVQAFSVEDYLISTCGLTRPQALKASTKLSHLKSSANPDAVLTFLAGLGLPSAEIAAAVAKDPRLLCAGVESTLAPVVFGLTDLGLSSPEIARLVSIVPERFRRRSTVSMLQFYQPLFGSFEKLLSLVQRRPYLLFAADLDNVVKPNLEFLRECGLDACNIAKVCIAVPRLLTTQPERVRAMAACAESIGVPCGSGMFRHALQAVAFLSEEKIAAKVDFLKKTFRWSDVEASIAVRKAPDLLTKSHDMLRRKREFLISEVGLEPVYIAHRPIMICLSLEGRLKPRHYVLKFLKQNGFLDRGCSFSGAVTKTDKYFVEKYICPHKEVAPCLAEDYAATCRGEVPAISDLHEPRMGFENR